MSATLLDFENVSRINAVSSTPAFNKFNNVSLIRNKTTVLSESLACGTVRESMFQQCVNSITHDDWDVDQKFIRQFRG